jgi:hypothetical protein
VAAVVITMMASFSPSSYTRRFLILAIIAGAVSAIQGPVSATSISLSVNPAAVISAVIPANFQGISIEWSSFLLYTTTAAAMAATSLP